LKSPFACPKHSSNRQKAWALLSSEHIERLLRADIQAQLPAMANDPDIQRETEQIAAEFSDTESDELYNKHKLQKSPDLPCSFQPLQWASNLFIQPGVSTLGGSMAKILMTPYTLYPFQRV
jgi:hypothetical protein